MKAWDPKEGTNIWEHSGLFEGDIMLHKKKTMTKNGLLDMAARWDTATVPYYIDDSFSMFFRFCYHHFSLNLCVKNSERFLYSFS